MRVILNNSWIIGSIATPGFNSVFLELYTMHYLYMAAQKCMCSIDGSASSSAAAASLGEVVHRMVLIYSV